MSLRDKFLLDIKEGDYKKFLDYVHRNGAKDDPFDFKEIIQSLANKKHADLWGCMLSICGNALTAFDLSDDGQENPLQTGMADMLETLGGIAHFAYQAIDVEGPTVPDQLLELSLVLHGVILSLPEEGGKVQNEISLLCELWYNLDLDGKEQLITNTLPYLLARTHTNGSLDNDFRRTYKMKDAFLLLDYDHESSESIKNLILQCFFHPSYFTVHEGKLLLSFFFGLHEKFSAEVHKLMRNQLPKLPQQYLEVIGEIYFKAWQSHSGAFKEKIEEFIQDFMYHTIHAKRNGGTNSMSSRLRKILGFIHTKKREPGVDEMLYRLYQPILWRALKVANPLVRMNAVSVLIDAFPIQDPNGSNADNDEILQRQFDTFAEMLEDPYPSVRAAVIIGVCRACSLFWEWIPANTVQDLLAKLVSDLAYDTSSADVRCAVYQGLKTLVDCRLSHPLLKRLLPDLKHLIHDTSSKVRSAFLDLLLILKGVRTLKFWTIVPFDQLLLRLEVESSTTCIKKIVRLLMGLYMPIDKGPPEQVQGCLKIVQCNRAAARKFYQYICTIVPASAVRKFLSYMTTYVTECCRRGIAQNNDQENQNENEHDSSCDEGFEEDGHGAEEDMQEREADAETVPGVIDILAVLIAVSQKRYKKEVIVKGKLLEKLSKALPEFLLHFESIEVKTAVMIIAKELPSDSIPSISESCLEAFKKLSSVVGSEEYGPLLQCLCQWNYCDGVLKHINHLLKAFMERKLLTGSKRKNDSVPDHKPELALRYLSWLLTHCHSNVIACEDQLSALIETLEMAKVQLSESLSTHGENEFNYGNAYCLSECLGQYYRLIIHSLFKKSTEVGSEVAENDVVDTVSSICQWTNENIIPQLNNTRVVEKVFTEANRFLSPSEYETDYTRKGKKKQLHNDGVSSAGDKSLVFYKLLNDFLSIISDVILIGFGSARLNKCLGDWINQLLEHDFTIPLIPQMIAVCFQMASDPMSKYNSQDYSAGKNPMLFILAKIASSLSVAFHDDKFSSGIGQILLASKQALAEIMRICHMRGNEDGTDRALMLVLAKEVVSDISKAVTKENIEENDDLKMPSVSGTLISMIAKSVEMKRTFLSALEQNILDVDGDLDGMLSILFVVCDLKKKGLPAPLRAKMSLCVTKLQDMIEKTEISSHVEEEELQRKKDVGKRLCDLIGKQTVT